MAKAACWLEDVAGITVEFIGRNALDRYSTLTLRASGKHLAGCGFLRRRWIRGRQKSSGRSAMGHRQLAKL
jgi:hypothetical protein